MSTKTITVFLIGALVIGGSLYLANTKKVNAPETNNSSSPKNISTINPASISMTPGSNTPTSKILDYLSGDFLIKEHESLISVVDSAITSTTSDIAISTNF